MIIVWRPRAREDFLSQIDYVHVRSPSAAKDLHDAVQRAVMRLELFPEMGRRTRKPSVRELAVGATPYVMVYRVEAAKVRTLPLFHVAQKHR